MRVTESKPERQAERARVKRHPLYTATPAQIDAYIENNINNLDDAKQLLKLIVKFIALRV